MASINLNYFYVAIIVLQKTDTPQIMKYKCIVKIFNIAERRFDT